MQSSSNPSSNDFCWQPAQSRWLTYRQLELISDGVPDPEQPAFAFGLNFLWRGLLNLLSEELVDEQRVEYLDRCWQLNETEARQQSPTTTLQRLWTLME